MTDFHELLARYRAESLSEAEKGAKFERLMRAYLLALPKYEGLLANVWLWRDFPYRSDFGSDHDLGIDLVALPDGGGVRRVRQGGTQAGRPPLRLRERRAAAQVRRRHQGGTRRIAERERSFGSIGV